MPTLVARLDLGPDRAGRELVVEALGAIGRAAEGASEALATVLRDWRGAPDNAALAAARALGRIGGSRAIAALIDAVRDEPDEQGPWWRSVRALRELRAREAVPVLLERWVDPQCADLRMEIASALAWIGPRTGPVADVVLSTGRAELVYGLVCSEQGTPIDPRVTEVMLDALEREEPVARMFGLMAAPGLDDPRVTASCLALLEQHRDPSVRQQAVFALGRGRPSAEVVAALERATTAPRNLRVAATEALSHLRLRARRAAARGGVGSGGQGEVSANLREPLEPPGPHAVVGVAPAEADGSVAADYPALE